MNKGWKNGRVGELISSLESGISVNGEGGTPADDDYAVLKVSAVTYGRFNPKASKKISGHEYQRAKCIPKKDQIIISRSNTPALVGASCYVEKDYPNRFLPDKLWQITPHRKKEVEHKWLAYFLASPWARFRLSKLATGTSNSMKNITKSELLTLPVPIPPLPEQKNIASFLECWDSAIEKTEALIALKSQSRELSANRLLFGQNRILDPNSNPKYQKTKWFKAPHDWSITKIQDIASEVVARNSCESTHTVLSCSKHVGFVESLKYFKKKVYSDNTENYKIIKYGEFGYPSNHIEEGSIGLQNLCEIGIVSPIYTVFQVNDKKISSDFLYKLLKTNTYRHIFQVSTSSSVDRRGSLRWKEFSKIEIPLPSLDEQTAIANTINIFDREITILKQLLENYRLQKRGLMQKLLTGEWQVNITTKATEEVSKAVNA
ncbi:MAG: hypothetical protein OFPII_36340 [Osedax symbiont Rs1]|nr:MAG: hypothetical protein OFPII_36340 [Osedax symbiont Rs1]